MGNKRNHSGKKVPEPENEKKELSEAEKMFSNELLEGLEVNKEEINDIVNNRKDCCQFILIRTRQPELLKCSQFREHLALMVWRFKLTAVLQFPSWAIYNNDPITQIDQNGVHWVTLSVVC